MALDFYSKNGELLPVKEAVVPLSSIEYSYGFGVYENIRVSGGVTYFLKDHVERLLDSATIIGLEHGFTTKQVERAVSELVIKNDVRACNIKILLIGAVNKQDAQLLIQCLNPLFVDRKLYRDGVDVTTYTYERAFPHAKTLNMLQSYLAYKQAREANAYDALLLNHSNELTEGTRTNFFCIKDKTIYTPPEADILLGVTRKALLKVATKNGYMVVERSIKLDDIAKYDSAFISSTSSKILPIKSIGRQKLSVSSEPLRTLIRLFDEFLGNCKGKL